MALCVVFFFKQQTAYDMRISDWSSDVCSSDLSEHAPCEGLIEEFMACSPLLQDLVHVVYGDGATGRALIDAGPAKIFFTGSGATGARIMAQAAQQLIPVELELGGKDPMIVFDDAHTPRAIAGAL